MASRRPTSGTAPTDFPRIGAEFRCVGHPKTGPPGAHRGPPGTSTNYPTSHLANSLVRVTAIRAWASHALPASSRYVKRRILTTTGSSLHSSWKPGVSLFHGVLDRIGPELAAIALTFSADLQFVSNLHRVINAIIANPVQANGWQLRAV